MKETMLSIAFLFIMLSVMAAGVYVSMKEAEAWEAYSAANNCQVESTRKQLETTHLMNDDGYPVEYSHTATYVRYTCDDGTTHERAGRGGLW